MANTFNRTDIFHNGRGMSGGSAGTKRQAQAENQSATVASKSRTLLRCSAILFLAALTHSMITSDAPNAMKMVPPAQAASAPIGVVDEPAVAAANNAVRPIVQDSAQTQVIVLQSDTTQESLAVARPQAVAAVETIPLAAGCAGHVEVKLRDLQARYASQMALPWSQRQDEVTQLVQLALDCPTTTLEVSGSLELLKVGAADLVVKWDREQQMLALQTVTASAAIPEGLISDQPAPWMNFILR